MLGRGGPSKDLSLGKRGWGAKEKQTECYTILRIKKKELNARQSNQQFWLI